MNQGGLINFPPRLFINTPKHLHNQPLHPVLWGGEVLTLPGGVLKTLVGSSRSMKEGGVRNDGGCVREDMSVYLMNDC